MTIDPTNTDLPAEHQYVMKMSELAYANARLIETGWRMAKALEAARSHGFHGGTDLLTEWASLASSDIPNPN